MKMKVSGLCLLCLLCPLATGTPFYSNWYQTSNSGYSGSDPQRQRSNGNWCAHVVHKNVTCAVVGGSDSFVQPEFLPCPPEMPHCQQQVIYRTHYRPIYKIGHKVVTELEWRCCPGYQGYDCREVKDLRLLQEERSAQTSSNPGQLPAPQEQGTQGRRNHPWRGDGQFGGQAGARPAAAAHRSQQSSNELEEEVQRLSQMVLDMQARITDMTSNLRLDFQEDASKMFHTLLNNIQHPAVARGGETEAIHLKDASFEHDTLPVDEIMTKILQVTVDLESKGNTLEDLMERVNRHDGQIHLLMEAADNPPPSPAPAPTPAPASGPASGAASGPASGVASGPATGPASGPVSGPASGPATGAASGPGSGPASGAAFGPAAGPGPALASGPASGAASGPASTDGYPGLRSYMDDKIQGLREELMEGMEIKMADLKNSCDYKFMSVKEQCEGQETNYFSLAELMDTKETDLRNEIQDLKSKLVDPGREGAGMPDSVLTRVENLEVHLNSSEKTVVEKCLTVGEKLKKERSVAMKDLKDNLEEKIASLEDRVSNLLVDSSGHSRAGLQPAGADGLQKDVDSLKTSVQTIAVRLDTFDLSHSRDPSAVVEGLQQDLQSCKTAIGTMETTLRVHTDGLVAVQGRLLNCSDGVENAQRELSSVKSHLGRLEDTLTDVVHQQPQNPQTINATWARTATGAEEDMKALLELHRTRQQELRERLDELGREVKAGGDQCRDKTEGVRKDVALLDTRVVNVEDLCGKLDPISGSIRRIKEGLNKHVTALLTCVHQLNATVRANSRAIGGLKGTSLNLQNHIENMAVDLQALTGSGNAGVQVTVEDAGLSGPHKTPTDGSVPEQAVMETGEAGPPGKMASSKLPGGSSGSLTTMQGFAGAPASPVKTSGSVKTSTTIISDVNAMPRAPPPSPLPPQQHATALGDGVSFSAGLTVPLLQSEGGIIRFNKVLVNDGGHYDPNTGVFTAPADGRYLVIAVLAAPRGGKVEAVLSVSNRSVQRLDSAGFSSPATPQQCDCSGGASLSLVLALKRGDRVGISMTGGKLADSASSSEILSSFGAALLYPSSSKR